MTKEQDDVSGIFFPVDEFDSDSFASLKMRYDFYDDFITAEKFEDGIGSGEFIVDPVDVGVKLAGISFSSGLLPSHCLFWAMVDGSEKLAIYAEPNMYAVSVQGYKETWHVPLPGLIFWGHKYNYCIYAVKDRPSENMPLYFAPVPNMSSNVCVGNVKFPQAGVGSIWDAFRLFFESGFSNHLSNGKSAKYGKSVLDMWDYLNKNSEKAYPLDDLMPCNKKLADLVGNNSSLNRPLVDLRDREL